DPDAPRADRSGPVSAATAAVVDRKRRRAPHDRNGRLRELLDPDFLAEAGWDEPNLVMRPPAGHRFLGRPVCRAAGCVKIARSASGICRGCSGRLARYGLTVDDIGSLPAPRHGDPGQYVVQGCP